MPRTARASVGGLCYHVLNRGNARAQVFESVEDYQSFLELLKKTCEKIPMELFAYCLMPNHFHLVLQPIANNDLGKWMHQLMTAHVRRHHKRHDTNGHIWGGRFKAFPIQRDTHLLTVLRYVERNPLRAGLVEKAEKWRWSSLHRKEAFLSNWPVPKPKDWNIFVNRPETASELEAIRTSAQRGRPFGEASWIKNTSERLGLEFTLRTRGRPLKEKI